MTLANRLYELQQIDLEIQRNQENLDGICRRLAEDEALIGAKSELTLAKQHLTDVEKRQKDMEWEIDDIRNSIVQLNDKLYGGKVKNPKELLGFEKELEMFKARVGQKEDELLELMAEGEDTRDKVKVAVENLERLEKTWQQEQDALVKNRHEIESLLKQLRGKRQALTSEITAQALDLYDGVKAKRGRAVVKVEQGRCEGCRIMVSMSEWQRVRSGTLVQCSSCGRILHAG